MNMDMDYPFVFRSGIMPLRVRDGSGELVIDRGWFEHRSAYAVPPHSRRLTILTANTRTRMVCCVRNPPHGKEGPMMQRSSFDRDGVTLSYLDSGGDRPLIVALHALWMEAHTFEPFAAAMPEWRVVSLDQRGHGLSDHASDYSRDALVGDIAALLDHLGAREPVVLIGNSLGGMNAYFFAARCPERVRAMVLEEAPPEQRGQFSFMLDWKGMYPTSEALEQKIGERLAWSVKPSFRETAQGWMLAFDPEELVRMIKDLDGDHWKEWLTTKCPALVVRGSESKAVDGKLLEAMATRRANSELVTLKAGHVVHHDDLPGFTSGVRAFLAKM
jgi:esterase